MKHYFFILLLLFVQYGVGQTAWKAELPVVEKSDYYNVELDQELIGAGLQYLKIFDENNKEVPYFIRSTDPIRETGNFESFNLIKNTVKDSLNNMIIDNKTGENLNRFCIIIQQAETGKYASVRGSNNLKQWYIVKQQTTVSGFVKPTSENTEMLIVDFPRGNYRYYEISLWNDQKNPLEVLKVGKIKNSNIYGNFTTIDPGKIAVENNDNTKSTCLSFPELKYTYCINKIEFNIKNKPDYYRPAILIDSLSYNNYRFNLSSGNENTLLINDFFLTPRTVIVIENQNNPPVVIDSVKFYGLCRYACLYLEAGKKYRLSSDNKESVSPEYDIEYFRNKIPEDIPVLKIENLFPIPEKVVPKRAPTFLERPVFLWGTIIIVGLFLVFICLQMIKGMKKPE